MKNSFDQTTAESPGHEMCSAKTCATCFENRGCIYEHYMSVAVNKKQEIYLVTPTDSSKPVMEKRA